MKKFLHRKIGWIFLLIFILLALFRLENGTAQSNVGVSLSGRVLDPQGLPVKEAEVTLLINGSHDAILHTETNHKGVFLLSRNGVLFSAFHGCTPCF